jgi:hypothetical protein
MKKYRVTLRADDAIMAFQTLRTSIQNLDELLTRHADDDLREIRAEKWQAYQRIAKALGLQPTLDKVKERAPA